jgi:hypothetical protein
MSHRTFWIVLSIASVALAAALITSYFLHRLTLAPASWLLLFLLVGVPIASLIRAAPGLMLASIISPEMREQMAEFRRQDKNSARAIPYLALSLAGSYIWVLVVAISISADSSILLPSTFAALIPFFIGYLGLLFSSTWLQRHSFVVALAGVAVLALSVGLFVLWTAHKNWGEAFLAFPFFLFVTGGQAIGAPVLVIMVRTFGFMD